MTLVERLKNVAEQKGTNFKQIEKICGIGNGNIRRWDTNSPSVSAFLKVADLLDVSTDYLLRGESMVKSDCEQELSCLIHGLSPGAQRELVGYVKRMLAEESVAEDPNLKQAK